MADICLLMLVTAIPKSTTWYRTVTTVAVDIAEEIRLLPQ